MGKTSIDSRIYGRIARSLEEGETRFRVPEFLFLEDAKRWILAQGETKIRSLEDFDRYCQNLEDLGALITARLSPKHRDYFFRVINRLLCLNNVFLLYFRDIPDFFPGKSVRLSTLPDYDRLELTFSIDFLLRAAYGNHRAEVPTDALIAPKGMAMSRHIIEEGEFSLMPEISSRGVVLHREGAFLVPSFEVVSMEEAKRFKQRAAALFNPAKPIQMQQNGGLLKKAMVEAKYAGEMYEAATFSLDEENLETFKRRLTKILFHFADLFGVDVPKV